MDHDDERGDLIMEKYTLEELQNMLAWAERQVICDDMIDDYQRRQYELKRSKALVEQIKNQIKEYENG